MARKLTTAAQNIMSSYLPTSLSGTTTSTSSGGTTSANNTASTSSSAKTASTSSSGKTASTSSAKKTTGTNKLSTVSTMLGDVRKTVNTGAGPMADLNATLLSKNASSIVSAQNKANQQNYLYNTLVDATGKTSNQAPYSNSWVQNSNSLLGRNYYQQSSLGTGLSGAATTRSGSGGYAGYYSGLTTPTYEYIDKVNVDVPTYEYAGKIDVQTPEYTQLSQTDLQAPEYESVEKVEQFTPSESYTQAMQYTQELLDKLNSGQTSYTDKLNGIMEQIEGRDAFNYDPNTDPLFQAYLQSSMNSGKQAMYDTMGSAAALTGGYGSSYATAAANGAYNNYVQEAYDNLTDYYNAALDAYNSETNNLYNMYNMYSVADSNEYNRLNNAYSQNYNAAQDLYNKEYQNYTDTNNYNMSATQYNNSMLESDFNNKLTLQNYNDTVTQYNNSLLDNNFNNELNLANANLAVTQYNNTLRDSEFNNTLSLAEMNNGITQYNNSLRDNEYSNAMNLASAKVSAASAGSSKNTSDTSTSLKYDDVYKEIDRAVTNYGTDSDQVNEIIAYYANNGYDTTRMINYANGGKQTAEKETSTSKESTANYDAGTTYYLYKGEHRKNGAIYTDADGNQYYYQELMSHGVSKNQLKK